MSFIKSRFIVNLGPPWLVSHWAFQGCTFLYSIIIQSPDTKTCLPVDVHQIQKTHMFTKINEAEGTAFLFYFVALQSTAILNFWKLIVTYPHFVPVQFPFFFFLYLHFSEKVCSNNVVPVIFQHALLHWLYTSVQLTCHFSLLLQMFTGKETTLISISETAESDSASSLTLMATSILSLSGLRLAHSAR